MLYDRWQQTAARCAGEPALVDAGSGRSWTFARLAEAGHAAPAPAGPVATATAGDAPSFVLAVLAAWRTGRMLAALEPGQEPPRAPAGIPPEVVHLKRTSGSTGTPRWVMFTAEQLAADADHIVTTMGLRHEWPNLGVISLAHSYGFSNLVLPLLLHGIPLHWVPAPLPEAVRQAASRMGDLTLPAVPAMWRAWHAAGAVPPRTRLAISAGAPLPTALEAEAFAASGVRIRNFYGASECGGIAFDRGASPRTDPALVGTPLDGVDVRVSDDGTLEVRGPAVGLGTWPDPDPRLAGGVFRPGDRVAIGPGGLRLLGRAGDVINVAGRKLQPEEVEQALRAHPAVRECVVVGVPSRDAGRGEDIAAVVAASGPCDEAGLRAHLLRHLPAWQVPRIWRFDPALAPDPRGKISRAAWRASLAGNPPG